MYRNHTHLVGGLCTNSDEIPEHVRVLQGVGGKGGGGGEREEREGKHMNDDSGPKSQARSTLRWVFGFLF